MKTIADEMRDSINVIEKTIIEFCQDSDAELAAEFGISDRGLEILGRRSRPMRHGSSRCAWEDAMDGTAVIKGEFVKGKHGARDSNQQEMKNWEFLQSYPDMKGFFCPVREISPCNWLLVMEKTRKAVESDFPEEMPAVFDRMDSHLGNFGVLDGKVVCIDYVENIPGLAAQGDYLRLVPVKGWHGSGNHRSLLLDMAGVEEPGDVTLRRSWRQNSDFKWDPEQDEKKRG